MKDLPDAFVMQEPDLGTDTVAGNPKQIVNMMLQESQYPSATPCLICGNTASYRLIPKSNRDNTAEIQDKGFICEHCLSMHYLDSNKYGIRKL